MEIDLEKYTSHETSDAPWLKKAWNDTHEKLCKILVRNYLIEKRQDRKAISLSGFDLTSNNGFMGAACSKENLKKILNEFIKAKKVGRVSYQDVFYYFWIDSTDEVQKYRE